MMAEEESQHEDQSPPVVERRDPTSQPVAPGDGQAPSLWLWRGQAGTSHSCLPSLPLRKPRTRGLSVYSLFGQKMGYVMPDVCETGSGPELRHTLQSQSPLQALLPLPSPPTWLPLVWSPMGSFQLHRLLDRPSPWKWGIPLTCRYQRVLGTPLLSPFPRGPSLSGPTLSSLTNTDLFPLLPLSPHPYPFHPAGASLPFAT